MTSADGGFVVFASDASNLVSGQADSNGQTDVFVYERASGVVTLVSRVPGNATTAANGASAAPAVSADGAFVAFHSTATNLVSGQTDINTADDVFLFERATGAVTLVSHVPASPTTTPNAPAQDPAMSSDGRFVAFHSYSSDQVASDVNFARDVFLFDRTTGVVTLVSHRPGDQVPLFEGGSLGAISADASVVAFTSEAVDAVPGQVEGNFGSDAFVYERATGEVKLVSHIPGNLTATGNTANYGTDGDIPVPGDYDNDGDTEIAVFRPANGYWFVNGGATVQFGTSGDIPVPADYDGDGKSDIAVFRPDSGVWLVHGGSMVPFGATGDTPVPGDYDGDGDDDPAVFRPSTGGWFVNGGPAAEWGTSGDIPAPGDYDGDGDGDGDTDMAVFRPANGIWFVRDGLTTAWGTAGDIPAPGDYDGDGDTDIAVYRPSIGIWFVQGGVTTAWGTAGDVPLPLPDAIRRFSFPPL